MVDSDKLWPAAKLKGLGVSGVGLTLAGLVLQWLHLCPIVKRIWTSSYTLYSGGLILLILAGFYAAMELRDWMRWAFPLMVIGANSIAIYVMSWTMEHFVSESLTIHLGRGPFLLLGAPFEPVLRGMASCSSSGGSSTGCTGRRSSSRSDPDRS